VGTKLDLAGGENGLRQVQTQEASDYALEKGYMFTEVSAFKHKNIELLLKMLKIKAAKLRSDG
jgi:Ras family